MRDAREAELAEGDLELELEVAVEQSFFGTVLKRRVSFSFLPPSLPLSLSRPRSLFFFFSVSPLPVVLLPDLVLHPLDEPGERLVHPRPHLPLALLLLDLVRVVRVPPAAAGVERLHDVHHLGVELHVVGFFSSDHDRVVQVEVHQRDHLALGRLQESVLDVAVHHVDRLAARARVAEAVGVCLERSRNSPSFSSRGLGADPDVRERVGPPTGGADELLLGDQGGALGAFLLSGGDRGAQRLDLCDDLGGRARISSAERDLLDRRRGRVALAGLEAGARAEEDADVGVVACLWWLWMEGVVERFEEEKKKKKKKEKKKKKKKRSQKVVVLLNSQVPILYY